MNQTAIRSVLDDGGRIKVDDSEERNHFFVQKESVDSSPTNDSTTGVDSKNLSPEGDVMYAYDHNDSRMWTIDWWEVMYYMDDSSATITEVDA